MKNVFHNICFMVTDDDLESATRALDLLAKDNALSAFQAETELERALFERSSEKWAAIRDRITAICDARYEAGVEIDL